MPRIGPSLFVCRRRVAMATQRPWPSFRTRWTQTHTERRPRRRDAVSLAGVVVLRHSLKNEDDEKGKKRLRRWRGGKDHVLENPLHLALDPRQLLQSPAPFHPQSVSTRRPRPRINTDSLSLSLEFSLGRVGRTFFLRRRVSICYRIRSSDAF